MWIGTDNGVNRLQFAGEKFTSFVHSTTDKSSLSHNETSMMHEDKRGRLWISSSGGLDLFDSLNKKVVSYTGDDGLPSSMIQSIEEDSHGILWLGSSKGIAAFDPATKKITNYTTEDGLQGPEFKNNCSYQSNDGYMFFGGNQGFNYFHPDSIKTNKAIPPVFITAFSILNKVQHPAVANSALKNVITETKEISISYKQNVITFEFAALNYISSIKNQYAYKMEGFDDDWIYCGTNRFATYTNLDAGSYTFKVKGCNNDGVWNEVVTAVTLVITPPFWKTTWFIVVSIFALITALIALFRYRVKLIQEQKLLLEEQVKKQTEQLVRLNKEEKNARLEAEASKALADEANKKLLLSNQEMEQFAYVASHDLKEPLRTISGLIQLLQKKYKGKLEGDADKYFTFIAQSSERMKVLINDLLEFSSIGSHATLSDIDTNLLLTTIVSDIDAAIRESNGQVNFDEMPAIRGFATEVKLLFQNLLINAIKFRKKDVPPVITITGKDLGYYWQFAVSDNGIGIPLQFREKIFKIFQRLHTRTEYEGSGIGLSHCSKIVAMHNGKLWVDSTEGEGSTFYFTIAKKI